MKTVQYIYNAEVVRIIDGDTIVVHIDLGLKQWFHKVHLRIRNIQAPEVRTRNKEEKVLGLAAKSYLEQLIIPGETVLVKTYKASFERYVADIWVEGDGDEPVDLAKAMVDGGHAKWVDPH